MSRINLIRAVIFLLLVSACTVSTVMRSRENYIALVIGNSRYREWPKIKDDVPQNDARGFNDLLVKLGFSSTKPKYDVDHTEMHILIHNFIKNLSKGKIGLFYYSGHGIQLKGENYLIPIDGKFDSRFYEYTHTPDTEQLTKDFNFILLDKDVVSLMLHTESNNIIIIDACRNNPFPTKGSQPLSGLAEPKLPREGATLVAYAATPNHSISSIPSEHGYSIYTDFLLREFVKKGNTIGNIFRTVSYEVNKETNGAQIPNYWNSGFPEDFIFNSQNVTEEISVLHPPPPPRSHPPPPPP